MVRCRRPRRLLAVLSAPMLALSGAASAQGVSEKDYFDELPVVLSVSRLAQPLNEVPGAVTVIDADTIRRSGARDIAEVLRLVPGFLFTYRNGANPVAAYHSGLDIYGSRMQVYLDGRSLYSSFVFGDTHLGLRAIVLEDIERIEVLRGSNSASYGANAFLGVVNIVTRNAADTQGAMISLTGGDRGVADNVARFGWGSDTARFRVTAARRVDTGLDRIYDDSQVSSLQVRGDLQPSLRDEVTLQAGASTIARGDGDGSDSTPFRTAERRELALSAHWRRTLTPTERLEFRAGLEEENFEERVLLKGNVGGPVSAWHDTGGHVRRLELGMQYGWSINGDLRAVVGGEVRHEALRAPALYATERTLSLRQWRTFGSIEWRPHEQWLLQASGTHEEHSRTGSAFSPRLNAIFHATPDHSLRAGVTRSQRAPTFYELFADVRWYNQTPGHGSIPVGTQIPVRGWPNLSSGNVKPETLLTREVGYLGHIRPWNLRVDMRGFVERMNQRILVEGRTVANPAFPAFPYENVRDFVNRPGPRLQGIEYQLEWRPLPETRLAFAQMHIRSHKGSYDDEVLEAPRRAEVISWFQALPQGFDLTVIATASTPFKWANGGERIDTPRRLDLRLAKSFALGATRGELSLTTQAMNGGHQIFNRGQRFGRRAFASLRLEF